MILWWSLLLVLGAGFLGGLGAFFFKKSSSSFSLSVDGILKNKNLILGCFSYALSVIFFVPALSGADVSVLYPLAATNYLWACFFSVHFLKENMTKAKWLSIALIIIGVTFLGGS
ncbi:EamA family transporter [Candidatus Woesearchaeota archaeon]|nr:EamA family transporter [Candidatus Woesearchaeota archaeon]